MQISKLNLVNFRCFREASISFDDRLTVILADNGFGKTAILDAVALGYARVLGRLPDVSSANLKDSDIRILENEKLSPYALLACEAKAFDGEKIRWGAVRRRDASVPARKIVEELSHEIREIVGVGMKEAFAFADHIIDREQAGANPHIPVFAYYGTNRSVRSEIHSRRGFRKKFSRYEALQGAFESTSQFKSAFEWFTAMEDQERREKITRKQLKYSNSILDAVRLAVERMLPDGYTNLRTETRPLRFVIDFKGTREKVKTFRITQLSDGYKTVLALSMDYARRLAQSYPLINETRINPEDVLAAPGTALIDEVDLHLHPNWQQTIIPSLLDTFPGTQFVLTTHSPQVLTTVPPSSLRKLTVEDGDIEIESQFNFSIGAEAQFALEDLQGVPSRPQRVPETKQLEEYLNLISEDKWDTDEARNLRQKLDVWGRGYETALVQADVDIRLRAFRRKNREKDKQSSE